MLGEKLHEIYKIYPFCCISITDNSNVYAVFIDVELYFRGKHLPIRNGVQFTLDEINKDERLQNYLVEKTLEQIRYFIDQTLRNEE